MCQGMSLVPRLSLFFTLQVLGLVTRLESKTKAKLHVRQVLQFVMQFVSYLRVASYPNFGAENHLGGGVMTALVFLSTKCSL